MGTITYASGLITVLGGYDSGTATSGGASTLTNTSKVLATNAHAGRGIWIYAGTGANQRRRITSNTATVYTVNYAWDIQPDNTSQYLISYNYADLYAANVAGGWGVYTLAGLLHLINSCIKVGNDSTASYFADYTKQVQFSYRLASGETISSRDGWAGFQVRSNALVVMGEQTGPEKTSQKGCQLLYNIPYIAEGLCCIGTGQIDFHSGSISSIEGYQVVFGGTSLTGVGKASSYNSLLNCNVSTYSATTTNCSDIYNTITSLDNAPGSLGPRVDGDYVGGGIYHCTMAMSGTGLVPKTMTMRGVIGRKNAKVWRFAGNHYAYLIDVDSDTWDVLNNGGTTWKLYRQWSANYSSILDDRITLIDNTGTVVFNETTDADGVLSEKIVSEGYYDPAHTSGDSIVSYNNHKLRLRKYGYKHIDRIANITSTIVEQIARDINPYVVSVESVASEYTATINGSTKTIATDTSAQNLYDYSQWWVCQSDNVIYDEPAISDGTTLTFFSGWVFTPGSSFNYDLRIAGGTIAFGTPGPLTPRLGTITIRFTSAGTYIMSGADFGGPITLTNTSGGSVTVELPAGVSYTNTGPDITVVEPQTYQSITVSGGVPGTRIQGFDLNGRGELFNLVPSSWPYTWTDSIPYTADIRFRVRAGKVGKLLITQEAGTATLSTPSVGYLLSQTDADIYNSKGIDGSTVTGIAIDDGNLTIELSSGTLVSTTRGYKLRVDPWKLFAYASWWETTEEGIRDEVQTVDAPDGGNIRIYSMGLKNTSSPSYTVELYGAYVVDAVTGYAADLVDSTGGNFSFAPDHVVVQYIDLAPGSSVITGDVSDIITPLSSLPTLANIEASTVLAKEATVEALVIPTGEEIAIDVLNAATTFPINANMVQTNNVALQGDGTEQNKFRSALIT